MSLKRLLIELSLNIETNYHDYKMIEDKPKEKRYEFETVNGAEYFVLITNYKNNIWKADFSSQGFEFGYGVEVGESTLKVLNTVFKIIMDFYEDNKHQIDGFVVVPSSEKRGRVYDYYIKKLFPNVKIEETNNKSIILYKLK